MKHKAYLLNVDLLTRIVRSHAHLGILSKKDKTEKAIQLALTYLYKRSPEMLQTLEFIIQIEEYHWLTSGKHVTFFDSVETAQALINSSYNIDNAQSLYTGMDSFMLALPDNLMLGGKPAASGLLVHVMLHDDRQSMVDKFCKWVGMKHSPQVTVDDWKGSTFAIYASYQQKQGSNEYIRFALPSSSLMEVMRFTTHAEYTAYMKATNKFKYLMGADLDAPEQAYQYDILRLIVGLMLYKKAMPDRVTAGMPSSVSTKDVETRYVQNPQTQTIHSPATHAGAERGSHYRSWHFRQLMADRFYKGEHEKAARGSRVVFVRDSMVNREIDAETVK